MPNITKRKIFKIGASYAITLPKSWVEWAKRELEKRGMDLNSIELEIESDNIVVIRLPEAGKEEK